MAENQPVARVSYGAVTLSIWENRSQEGRPFHNFKLQRSYQDQAGQWQNTDTFRLSDCMSLVACIWDGYRWISTEGKRRARQQGQPDDATATASGVEESTF